MRNTVIISLTILAGAIVIAGAILTSSNQTKKNSANNPALTPTLSEPSPEASPTTEITLVPSKTDEEKAIKESLIEKTGISDENIKFSVGEKAENGKVMRGTVQDKNDIGGAGFFAVLQNGKWMVTYVGQGVPKCSEVNPYSYPLEWADYCLDAGNNTIKR